MSIDDKIERVLLLSQEGKTEEALILCENLIKGYPLNAQLWFLKSSVHSSRKDYNEALGNIRKAIEIAPEEAVYSYNKGIYNFEANFFLESIDDFDAALRKSNKGDDTLTQYIYFYRAEALIKLDRKKEALKDVVRIPDGFQIWTFGLRKKEDLMREAQS